MPPPLSLLIVDDDSESRMLAIHALEECRDKVSIHELEDGQQLIDYLEECYAHHRPFPSFILLDLNMPKIDGRTALRYIRQTDHLKHIPVLIFSTAWHDLEVRSCYMLGANGYFTKPDSYSGLIVLMTTIVKYWTMVKLCS